MGATEWAVVVGGIAAIVGVNWYFLVAGRTRGVTVANPSRGPAEVAVVVRGGYEPATIRVAAGTPLRIVFDRQETSSCSEEVVFPDFGVRTFLPAFEKTAVTITPPAPGTYEFTCGMSMLHGRVIAE